MNASEFGALTLRYGLGFGAALILSVTAYLFATEGWIESAQGTMAILLCLAVIQLVIQLVCFLHLGSGRSRDRVVTIGFTILMMLVIVIGSLWIMRNLDYRMGMSPDAMNEYMKAQNKKGF
jgi:cytochrome o ubiquinol oxidase operon protein cyoD